MNNISYTIKKNIQIYKGYYTSYTSKNSHIYTNQVFPLYLFLNSKRKIHQKKNNQNVIGIPDTVSLSPISHFIQNQ
jgi:hypothetical protein